MSLNSSGTGVYLRGSFERTSTATPGYSAGITTKTDFSAKGALGNAFAMSVTPDANKPLQLTDVMPDTKFAVPIVPHTPVLDVSQPVREKPADPSSQIKEVNNAKANYLEANKQCMNKICDAIIKADPEAGPGVIGKLMEPAATSGVANALTTALDAGTGMGLWTVINSMYKAGKSAATSPSDTKVAEVLTKALSELHKSNAPVVSASAAPGVAPEQKFDFSAIKNAKQLQNFMERDPMEDDVMMELAVAEQNLAQMADNKTRYDNDYHRTGNLTAKMTLAQEQGDKETIKKIAESEVVAEAVIAGAPSDKVVDAVHMPSEVGGMSNFLTMLNSANITTTSATMFSNTTNTTMKPVLANEPKDPEAFSLKSAFSPSMNS